MLLSQIDPGFAAKRTMELGVNLHPGRGQAHHRAGGDRPLLTARTVVHHLQDHGDLGSVDEPGQFFGGVLPMRWGAVPGDADPSLVWKVGDVVDGLYEVQR